MSVSKFDIRLGEGSFGVIFGSRKDDKIAIKAIRTEKYCDLSKIEIQIHRKIYKTHIENVSNFNNIIIPRPGEFHYLENNVNFKCFYLMDRLHNPYLKNGPIFHLVFNTDHEYKDNKNDYNPLNKFRSKFGNKVLENILHVMGKGFSLVTIGAKLDASDIEFLLVRGKNGAKVGIVDFGMCSDLDGNWETVQGIQIDAEDIIISFFEFHNLYVPYFKEETTGFTFSFLYGFMEGGHALSKGNRFTVGFIDYLYLKLLHKIKYFTIFQLLVKVFSGLPFAEYMDQFEVNEKIFSFIWNINNEDIGEFEENLKRKRFFDKNILQLLIQRDYDIEHIRGMSISKRFLEVKKDIFKYYHEGLIILIFKMVSRKRKNYKDIMGFYDDVINLVEKKSIKSITKSQSSSFDQSFKDSSKFRRRDFKKLKSLFDTT